PHRSSNPIGEVLEGEDVAAPLIEAASAGDLPKLRTMLEDPSWAEIALRRQQYVDTENRPAENREDVRAVATKEDRGNQKALVAAAKNGHAEVVEFLLNFTTPHAAESKAFVSRPAIIAAINNDHTDAFVAMAKIDRNILFGHLDHKHLPIDLAIMRKNLDMVTRVLELMKCHPQQNDGYWKGRLRHAARCGSVPILKLLLDNGYTIPGTGALHGAAERNAVDRVRFLVEQGADVDEMCPAEKHWLDKSWHDSALWASWVPMHFAAHAGNEAAVGCLESLGAKTDVKDVNGKTPSMLLEEWK
ncbi:ankyrin, partial [Dissoconium aciculare CBS 342.82]|uniref:Ankyrin n=1 Tax=Dissoconium aciculare CBS 342.82 TaxID=1314786 RepID=A0A6J3M217_9PEZI